MSTTLIDPTKGMGALPADDYRDWPMATALADSPTPPWWMWQACENMNQGMTPQCVGYTWWAFIKSSPLRTSVSESPEALYLLAQILDEWPGENYMGTSLRGGIKALEQLGRISEYRFGQTAHDVKLWLHQRGTVALSSPWYADMFAPDAGGFIKPTGLLAGWHAYLAIGYDDARQAFRCLNSWGISWGQWGRFWLPYEVLDNFLQVGGSACSAIEKAPA